ncbi:uncharacterized protein BJX67DRAFT_66621 [Aspergillus lucknowensis]|uniref:Uncharacterized protein n=1 Tax=Aspergillus lucknowensis TaxID=176173 RepID=A0ABR4LUK4_9EURO
MKPDLLPGHPHCCTDSMISIPWAWLRVRPTIVHGSWRFESRPQAANARTKAGKMRAIEELNRYFSYLLTFLCLLTEVRRSKKNVPLAWRV